MTVCIAAICNGSRDIVTASDRMISWTHTSSESALKAARIAPKWISMLAGDDITVGAEDVLRHVRATLDIYNLPPNVLAVQGALLGAWRDVQNQIGQTTVLNPYRFTVEEFRRAGPKQLGESKFMELASRLEIASRVQCQMLVCGFDENGIPNLLVIDDELGCRDFTRAGFMAIGSGHTTALASLSFHEYKRECGLSAAIYRVCAAKFMAERSLGVGQQTIVMVLREDGKTCWIVGKALDGIRALWESDGKPRMPDDAKINDAIDPSLGQWTSV